MSGEYYVASVAVSVVVSAKPAYMKWQEKQNGTRKRVLSACSDPIVSYRNNLLGYAYWFSIIFKYTPQFSFLFF